MTKLAIAAAAIGLMAAGVAFAAGIDNGGDDRGFSTSTTTTTTGTTTTDDRAADLDRRNHRAKKAKKAKRIKKARRHDNRIRRRGVRAPGEDVRGPCDEAEHASDPRCTGAAHEDERGRSGRGRSGSNSGPG